MADLPGKEVLLAPGRRDGQTVMVRDGASVTCHSWSAGEQLWKKVGDVVGASGGSTETSGKVLHDGKVRRAEDGGGRCPVHWLWFSGVVMWASLRYCISGLRCLTVITVTT